MIQCSQKLLFIYYDKPVEITILIRSIAFSFNLLYFIGIGVGEEELGVRRVGGKEDLGGRGSRRKGELRRC